MNSRQSDAPLTPLPPKHAAIPAFEIIFFEIWFHVARDLLPVLQDLPPFPGVAPTGASPHHPAGATPSAATPPGQVTVAPGEHTLDPTRVRASPGGQQGAPKEGARGGIMGFFSDVGGSVKDFGKDIGRAFGVAREGPGSGGGDGGRGASGSGWGRGLDGEPTRDGDEGGGCRGCLQPVPWGPIE